MAMRKPTPLGELSPNLNGSLDDQIDKLKHQVIDRAFTKAQQRADLIRDQSASALPDDVPVDISLQDVSDAFSEAIGQRNIAQPEISFFDLFSPFTCLCFLLCLIFGTLGMFALKGDARVASSASGFLDIAKIFAGALVGSTTSTVLSAVKSRRGIRR